MDFSKDELKEAKRQIDSTLHKLRETIKTFKAKENEERYKLQITLAKRRVEWELQNGSQQYNRQIERRTKTQPYQNKKRDDVEYRNNSRKIQFSKGIVRCIIKSVGEWQGKQPGRFRLHFSEVWEFIKGICQEMEKRGDYLWKIRLSR